MLSPAMEKPFVYLDNAASTRPAGEVETAVAEATRACFANPSSAHTLGGAAARALEAARAAILATLGTEIGQLIFTSGGTEANALGVLGVGRLARGRHLVTTAIEHPAVLRNAALLTGERSFEITRVAPEPESGRVTADAVRTALRRDTALVAVMLVNNEVGTIQPIVEIARALDDFAAREGIRRPHLHVDAVQAFGVMSLRTTALAADSVALSAHKLHGPKGVGALWLRPGARVTALWDGGRQEHGLRSGTENVPAIVGFARAATLTAQALKGGAGEVMARLRDDLEARVYATVPAARPTVTGAARAPHIASIAFAGLPAEPLLHALEARGVFVSAGSACASKTRGPSHVLKAIGVDDDTAVLRFSLERATTADDVVIAAEAVAAAVATIETAFPAPTAAARLAKARRTG
jgi:cysteine desulfurase